MFDEREIYRLQRECDIDRWYDALKDVTMRTEFVPLSVEEGGVILEGWKVMARSMESKQVDKILEQEALRGLVGKLETLLATFPAGAFARLGTRSPKDSKLIEERGRKFLRLDSPQGFRCRILTRSS